LAPEIAKPRLSLVRFRVHTPITTARFRGSDMKRIRVTIRHNPDYPADDLRLAARVRQDLWANSPVEIDMTAHATHRDGDRNAYFEFNTNYVDEVHRVINENKHGSRASVTVVNEQSGPECLNCGNISGPVQPTVCTNCDLRDISPCPYCKQEVSRQAYISLGSDLFKCPACQRRVRLRLNDPLFDPSGSYRQPVVNVEAAGE